MKGDQESNKLFSLKHYENAVKLDSKNPEYWWDLGNCLFDVVQNATKFDWNLENVVEDEDEDMKKLSRAYECFVKVDELTDWTAWGGTGEHMKDIVGQHFMLYERLGSVSGMLKFPDAALLWFQKQKELFELTSQGGMEWTTESIRNLHTNFGGSWIDRMEEKYSEGHNYFKILAAFTTAKVCYANALEVSPGDEQIKSLQKKASERFNEIMKESGEETRDGEKWICPECGEECFMVTCAVHYMVKHPEKTLQQLNGKPNILFKTTKALT